MKSLKIKTLILIAAMGIITIPAMAQNANNIVPQNVQTAFSSKYPQAQLKAWKVKHDTCMAMFTLNTKKYVAKYAKDGDWYSTERIIRHESSLPPEVQAYLKTSKYASWYIDDMRKVNTPMQSMYVVYLDNDNGNQMVYENVGSVVDRALCFNDNGKLVKVIDNNQ